MIQYCSKNFLKKYLIKKSLKTPSTSSLIINSVKYLTNFCCRMDSNQQQINQTTNEENQDEVLAKKQKLNDEPSLINTDNNNGKDLVSILTKELDNDEKKNKKKKYGLLIGYSGTGYYGLQRLHFLIV